MQVYKTKSNIIPGNHFKEVKNTAIRIFRRVKAKTKRNPYIRSAYFKKEKVFLSLFWSHLFEKGNHGDRTRRLRYFEAGLELIEKSMAMPLIIENSNNRKEMLYRFTGITPQKEIFYVQVKENKSSNRKDLISIFPK